MLASFVQISVLHTLILGESLIVVGYAFVQSNDTT